MFEIFIYQINNLDIIAKNFDTLIDCQDSQLIDLEVSSSLQLRGNIIYHVHLQYSFLKYRTTLIIYSIYLNNRC